ncbi:MAG: hypothetical protein JWM59_2976 [Verrucomicrobiales bacterium]|nr:hypothetical protein [Verrucomicrobiales bacterium]
MVSRAAAAPVNDDFEAALPLAGLPATAEGTNAGATLQSGEPGSPDGYGRASLWWRWIAPSSGWVEIDTLGSGYDTELAVHTGAALTSLTPVKYNDDAMGTRQSRLRFNAAEGTEYRIQVLSWLQDPGTAALRIQAGTAPQPATVKSLKLTPDSVSAENSLGSYMIASSTGIQAPDGLRKAVLLLTGPQGGSTRFDLAGREPASAPGDPATKVYNDLNVFSTSVLGPAGGPSVLAGEWKIQVLLTDDYGETTAYGGLGDPPLPAGSTTHLTVTGSEDTNNPVLTSATVTPDTLDIGGVLRTLTLEMAASDDRAMGSFSVTLVNPVTGAAIHVNEFSQVSGSPQQGVWRGTFTVPALLAPGEYQLEYSISDLASRGVYYSTRSGMPLPAGVQGKVTLTNTGAFDTVKPVVKSATASALRFAADAVPDKITIRVEAEDDMGITSCGAGFYTEWNPGSTLLQKIQGTGTAGVWEGTVDLRSAGRPGIYPMNCYLLDQAGNRTIAGAGPWSFLAAAPAPPAPALPVITITPGARDAYTLWRAGYPPLAGAEGEFDADADHDGFINAVEFLCGTDPLLPSGPGKPDPRGERAPRLTADPSGLRLEYRLSAANVQNGEGTYWELRPSFLRPSLHPGWSWPDSHGGSSSRRVAKDLLRAELPFSGSASGFMRLTLQTSDRPYWFYEP